MNIILAGLLLLSTAAAQGRKTGSLLDHLPRTLRFSRILASAPTSRPTIGACVHGQELRRCLCRFADVDASDPTVPKIVNGKVVHESKTRDCAMESQDFYDNDSRMTFSCYQPQGMASAMSIDLVTGRTTNLSNAPGICNEAEGIWPGGKYSS